MIEESRHDLIDALKHISDAEIRIIGKDNQAFDFLAQIELQLISRLVSWHDSLLQPHGILVAKEHRR